MTTALYTVFHLNLAFSSIEKNQRHEVIKSCYRPLLELANQGVPVGLEMTAYTLEAINRDDPSWVTDFKRLLHQGKCELIASGDSQIIGPLVPADVNTANLRLGQTYYRKLLDIEPGIAYVNEQAVSAGLLDIYIDAGFEAVIVEWDNPFSHNTDWQPDRLRRPQSLKSANGREIKVIWNHAIAFQKFQRYAHGELTTKDYLDYLIKVIKPNTLTFPVYGSDAEVFDFRPGRYTSEASQISGEWQRIKQLFLTIKDTTTYRWVTPSDLLSLWEPNDPLCITNAHHPVSVKKQDKYNICRWGLSGRNDLLLNTLCFQKLRSLRSNGNANDTHWRSLCRFWASDLRTHLTKTRYMELNLKQPTATVPTFQPWQNHNSIVINYDAERRRLDIKTPFLHLSLNANRGLAIDSLAFASHDFAAVIGTLSHGHFDHISYGADFYSNHLLVERFRERDRVADLNLVSYELGEKNGCLVIYCRQNLKSGQLVKWYLIDEERLLTGFSFGNHMRPEASVRLGYITLLNCEQRAWYETRLGGHTDEFFQITDDIDLGTSVSSIVSSNSALGATDGIVKIGCGSRGVRLSWDPANCATLPMISSKKINSQYLNRLWFSLSESDETLKEGGSLLDLTFCIEPVEINNL